ncbi:MAG TPA: hypothetical protein VFY88_10330, partial [Intrasporangium sp.]|nr:hypothetical protein [Intrasporangium sp.]
KMIAQANHLRDEPALASLVVHKHDGRVGAGYDEVRRLAGQPPIADEMERENHAAAARLECYRRWCDDVPADARPTLVTPSHPVRAATPGRSASKAAPASSRATSRSREERRGGICPTCFMEMPVAGPCPNCS